MTHTMDGSRIDRIHVTAQQEDINSPFGFTAASHTERIQHFSYAA